VCLGVETTTPPRQSTVLMQNIGSAVVPKAYFSGVARYNFTHPPPIISY